MSDGELRTLAPLTRKGQETRQRIIRAAADLIFEHGVAAFSLDSLRDATGTSSSQIYHYFSDKGDLVHAVIEYQRDRVLGPHLEAFSALNGWDDFQTWRDMIVALQAARSCRNGCPLGGLVNGVVESDEVARELLSDAFSRWGDVIAEGLKRMIDIGALRADVDPSELAVGVLASLQGGLLMAEAQRSTRPLEIALDASISYLKTFTPI
jgi:AcrR family transcriptional regulator